MRLSESPQASDPPPSLKDFWRCWGKKRGKLLAKGLDSTKANDAVVYQHPFRPASQPQYVDGSCEPGSDTGCCEFGGDHHPGAPRPAIHRCLGQATAQTVPFLQPTHDCTSSLRVISQRRRRGMASMPIYLPFSVDQGWQLRCVERIRAGAAAGP